jgi:hypothetical protein
MGKPFHDLGYEFTLWGRKGSAIVKGIL